MPVRRSGGSGGLADRGEAALVRAGRGLYDRGTSVGLTGHLYDVHVQGDQALVARQAQELMISNSIAVRVHRTPPRERRLQATGLSPSQTLPGSHYTGTRVLPWLSIGSHACDVWRTA